MAGVLDFISTPEGQGLLSAAFGGLAGAGRGDTWNNIGRAGLAGLVGYQSAKGAQLQGLQLEQMKQKMADEAAQRKWRQGLSAMMAPKLSGSTDQGKMLADQQADFGVEGVKSLVDSANYAPNADLGVDYTYDKDALQRYMLQPDSPYAEKLIEQQIMPKPEKYGTTPFIGADGKAYLIGEGGTIKSAGISGKTDVKEGYLVPDGNGGWKVDPMLYRAALGARSAGAAKTSVFNNTKDDFKNERDLRNDFSGLPTTKAFNEVQSAYDQINVSLSKASPAGDLAAATKLMKILDPGSVVRESELGMAMQASGLMDRAENYAKMVVTGQKLTPTQRKDFGELAERLYGAAADRYDSSANEYRGIASQYNLEPDRIAKPAKRNKAKSTMSGGGWSATVVK